jgi:hypothetical protein
LEAESDESEEEEESGEEDAEDALKRPAAKVALKRPAAKMPAALKVAKAAAAPMKDKAMKVVKAAAAPMKAMKAKAALKAMKKDKKPKVVAFIVPANGKKPKASFKPVHYNGGRIYWSKSKKSWRAYIRKEDKVEVSVNLGADADTAEKGLRDKQWRKCLKAIDQDPRPMNG